MGTVLVLMETVMGPCGSPMVICHLLLLACKILMHYGPKHSTSNICLFFHFFLLMVCNVCNNICSGNHKNVYVFFKARQCNHVLLFVMLLIEKNITNTLTIIELIINNLHNTNLKQNLI